MVVGRPAEVIRKNEIRGDAHPRFVNHVTLAGPSRRALMREIRDLGYRMDVHCAA